MNGYGDQPEFRFDKIQLDPFKKYIIPVAFVIGIIILGYSSMFTVRANEEAAILRFGKYMETVGPGLHFKLPFGIDKVYAGEVKRIYNEEFGYRTLRSGRESIIDYNFRGASEVSLMLTGDRNCANVHWVVRYKINNLKEFLFNVRDVNSTIRDVSETVMRGTIGDMSIDEVLTIGRRKIEEIEETEGRKNKVIPAAMGKKEQTIREAEGYKIKRINEATGDTKAFLAVWKEYEKAKDVTRRRLYLETMSRVIPKCEEIYIIDKDQKGILPILNLGEGKAK